MKKVILFKLTAITLFVLISSTGFFDRAELLIAQDRLPTLAIFLMLWGFCLLGLWIAALQPNFLIRFFWAVIFTASTSASILYYNISQSELSTLDVLSLWYARHDTNRAIEQHYPSIALTIPWMIMALILFLLPSPDLGRFNKWVTRLSFVPALPIAMITAIIVMKQGSGSQALPAQVSPLAVVLVTFSKIATKGETKRKAVDITPTEEKAAKVIILLVDESIRGDYLDFTPGNALTPNLANLSDQIANFGISVSGATCSHYSNAILRLGGNRENLITTVHSNPNIWQFAKKAGYHTVYIDAQAGLHKNPGILQNFMTATETQNIDKLIRISSDEIYNLDFEMLSAIERQAKSGGPVFIYANKNGAHFPYESSYPRVREIDFVSSKDSNDRFTKDLNSYLNSINWTVDEFFAEANKKLNLTNSLILYTSDHGQALKNEMTHCTVSDPDPREAIVPLFAMTKNDQLLQTFESAAERHYNKTSHFQITPTLLQMMGFSESDTGALFGPSLLSEARATDHAFTSGDIFGIFKNKINWTKIDTNQNYIETQD